MDVVPARAHILFAADRVGARFIFTPEPRVLVFGPNGLGAAILVVQLEWHRTEQPRAFATHITGHQKRPDVLADAVVEIGVPADRLILQRLPPHEDVQRRFAFKDCGQLVLEPTRSLKAFDSAGNVGLDIIFLLADPVTEIAVRQLLKVGLYVSF